MTPRKQKPKTKERMKKEPSTPAAKPAKAPKQKKFILRDFVSIKHTYSRDERDAITSKLTGAVQQAGELELQMKSVAKDYKAKIDTAKGAEPRDILTLPAEPVQQEKKGKKNAKANQELAQERGEEAAATLPNPVLPAEEEPAV